jgi:hypothetical protein
LGNNSSWATTMWYRPIDIDTKSFIIDNITNGIIEFKGINIGSFYVGGYVKNQNSYYKITSVDNGIKLDTNDTISGISYLVPKINLHYTQGKDLFGIDIVDNKKIFVFNNTKSFEFELSNINYSTWYGIVINVSNIHSYIGVYIWGINTNNDGLVPVYKHEMPISTPILVDESKPSILGSDSHISNVRILRKKLDSEYQPAILTANKFPKPSLGFVIDNCEPIFNTGNVGSGDTMYDDRLNLNI